MSSSYRQRIYCSKLFCPLIRFVRSYAQCTPRRFKQEIIAAAKDSNNLIVMENMQKVLKNIGASQKLTDEELQLIFAEVGDAGAIPADRLATLF